MATWVNIKSTTYSGSTGNYNQGLTVTLQYDVDSITPTSMKIRFSTTRTGTGADGYYILWNPGTSSEELFLAKKYNTAPTTSHSITLTKSYNATSYSIPAYWICHFGSVTPTGIGETGISSHYVNYRTASQQTVYNYFTNSRKNYKTVVNAYTYSVLDISGAYYTNGGAPTISSVTDNGDNTFSVSGTLGTAGTNNSLSSATLFYTTNGTEPSESNGAAVALSTSNSSFTTNNISIPSSCTKVRTKVYCYFKYGKTYSAIYAKDVKYYAAPKSLTDAPTLSYSKSKLTNKENWKFSWVAAEASNSNSPVKGYRIRLYKREGTGADKQKIHILDSDGNELSVQNATDPTDYYYDMENTNTSIIIYPAINGFNAGDFVQIGITPYTKNGKSEKLFSTIMKTSQWNEVENAGIVRVNTNSGFIEGQVYVCIPKSGGGVEWKEAETVNVYVNGDWKESQ